MQYNKIEFNQAQYGPYPAKVSSDRVTDENAPVKVLVPAHPVFTSPNRIDESSVAAAGCRSAACISSATAIAKYVDLVEMEDPFAYNKGASAARWSKRVRQGAVAVCRPRAVAAAAGRDRWRVPADGESAEPGEEQPSKFWRRT